jgi:hypothetical protein
MDKLKELRFKLMTKLAIGAAIAFVVAPIILTIIGGMLGLAIAAVVGGTLMALMPAASTKLTVWKFKALEHVVRENPVEVMRGREQERAKELNDVGVALDKQAVALEKFKGRVGKLVKEYPEDTKQYEAQLADFELLFAGRVEQYKNLKRGHADYQRKVVKAQHLYEVAMMAQETGAAMNAGEDFMSKFKEEIAFDEVETQHFTALAQMKRSLIDDDFVREQIKDKEVRSINYSPDGRVQLGNILQPLELKAVPA